MASITFGNPTSSSVFDKETTVNITWSRTPSSGGTNFVTTIVSNLNGALTNYSWTIPESIVADTNYTIQVHTTHDDGGGGSP